MSSTSVLRSAIVHVRTPLYFNAYALILSNVLTSGLGLVFWSVAARQYPPAALGIQSAVLSMMLFLSGVAQLNLRVALFRLLPEAGASAGRLVWRSYSLVLVTSALIGGAVFGGAAIVGAPWGGIPELVSPLGVLLLVVGTMSWSVFNLQDGVLAGLRRTLWVPIENGAYATAKIVVLALVAAALPTLGLVVSWILPAVVAVVGVSVVLAWRWLPTHMTSHAHRELRMDRGGLLGFIAADSVGALFALAASTLLPVLVVAIAGAESGAYFAIAWTVVAAINLVPLNMSASMTIETVHAAADLGTETRRLIIHMIRLVLPVVVLLIVIAPWLLGIFGPQYAANATDALRIALIAVVPFAANAVFFATCRVRGQGRWILAVQMVAAVITLGGTLPLLGPLGVTGVAIAWLVAQSTVAVATTTLVLWPLVHGARPGASRGGDPR